MSEEAMQWRRCSGCKQPIEFAADYWVCNVSTCNRKGNAFVFCSVECWDGHLGIVRHRESWAVEAKAPSRQAWAAEQAGAAPNRPKPGRPSAPPERSVNRPAVVEAGRPARRILPKRQPAAAKAENDLPREVLIIASKLKSYIRARSGFNTSDRVLEPLSRLVRELCDDAIERAERDERKTVLDRDLPKTLR